jgi:hypothetical protein
LEELQRDETIKVELRRPEPKSGPESKPQRGYARTLITLCNYDKFQKMAKWAKEAKGQRGNRNVDQKQPTIPGILRVAAEQPIKPPKTKESFGAEVERRIDDTKPRHRKDKMVGQNRIVFLDYGSEDWLTYAADYKTVTGTAIFPSIYLGGRGNWFFEQGEAVNPKRRRRKRA